MAARKNFITKGTSLSTAHYNISENFYYYAMIIGIPFILALTFSFLTLYYGESMFMKHNIISTYFNNLFNFSGKIFYNGEYVSKSFFTKFAEAAFEKKNIWTIFYSMIFIWYVGLLYPTYKVIQFFIYRINEKMKEEHIRGSIVIEDKEYAEEQKRKGEDKGILLSFVYDFEHEGKDKKVEKTIKQFKKGEVSHVNI